MHRTENVVLQLDHQRMLRSSNKRSERRTRFGRTIYDHGLVNIWQRSESGRIDNNRVRPRTGNVEVNLVWATDVKCIVGREDRFAERDEAIGTFVAQ